MSVQPTTQVMNTLCNDSEIYANLTTLNASAAAIDPGIRFGTVIVSVLTSLLSLLIVVGNGLIIMSVAIVKKLRQPANYLIVSLALSDFLVGLIVLPLTIVYDIVGEWVFGSMMCDVHVSFDVICCTASIMNLCMISIDRYLMITRPMTYPKRRNGTLMAILIATAWLISCLVIIPALFGFTENVKDGPGWLKPAHLKVIEESDNPVVGPSEINGVYWNGSHSAEEALDENPMTFWDPGTRAEKNWNFLLDLGQSYKITKVSVQNAGDKIHDVTQYLIQAESCSDNDKFSIVQKEFYVKPGTTEIQESQMEGDLAARYIRMKVNNTYQDFQPKLREFGIYGEKLHGKACLISQEGWFTIYSTLGAFYLPLGVMLCMYWKIYVEASRFKTRRRTKSPSISDSQDFSNTLTSTIDHHSIPTENTGRFFKRKKKNSDNHSNIANGTTQQSQPAESCLTDSNEHLLSNALKTNCVTVVVTNDFDCEKNSDTVFDEETASSEYEFHASDGGNLVVNASSSFKNINSMSGNEWNGESANEQIKLQNSTCFSPTASGVCDVSKTTMNKVRTLLNHELNKNSDDSKHISSKTHSSALIKPKHGSVGNGLNNGEQRFPTISEDAVFDINDNDSSASGCSFSRANPAAIEKSGSRKRLLYTRSQSCGRRIDEICLSPQPGCQTSQTSLFSGTASCCPRPVLCRASSSPSPSSSNSPLVEASSRRCSDQRKTSSSSRCGQNGEAMPISNGRRATVFYNIRRRVSMATSRDRMRNVKATRTLGIVVGAFTFCWLPFFIVTFLRPIICEEPESQDCIPLWLVRLVLWLGYLNSVLNPLIYIGFSPDLRETFRFLLSCKCANVDRRLAQTELRNAISREKRTSITSRCPLSESIL